MVKRKTKFRDQVLHNIRRWKEEYANSPEYQRRKTARWLNDNTMFDHGYTMKEEYHDQLKVLFDELVDQKAYKRHEKWKDFLTLMANLLHRKSRPVAVSRNEHDWINDRYGISGIFTIQLMDAMKDKGLIDMKLGFHTEEKSRYTRIWATEKLLSYLPIVPDMVVYSPVELVELRDNKGKLIDYVDTRETERIRRILERTNKVNADYAIRHKSHSLHPYLFAIFKRKFTLYGRLHTRGYRHYQGFSEEERSEITIDGEPIIELDFSGMHPRLLYAKEGIQYDQDPYSVVDKRKEARPFLKQILLSQLNSKDDITAEKAANYWLYRNKHERARLQEIGITRARPLIEAFRKAHKPISHYFCSGKDTGLRTMNLDSKICLEVLNHFSKKGIAILAVHDSFLVQERHKDELFEVMDQAYRKHTGGYTCPIK